MVAAQISQIGTHFSCPYDSVIIYDGDSPKAPIIQKICGLQQQLVVFSEFETLCIEFISGNPPFQEHRGFKLKYTFSKEFVDIGT